MEGRQSHEYEEKRVKMNDLCKALDANFEGFEELRQMLINKAPKYGNDMDYVDDISREVYDFTAAKVRSHRGLRGNLNTPTVVPGSANVGFGLCVGALPSGRRAQDPLADGVSPAPGMDRSGITANIKSITKLDHSNVSGLVYNLWLSGQSLSSPEGRRKFMDLVKTYHDLGGYQIQVNCIDKEVLKNAQRHPEKYPTLIVRVANYSAYFIDLPKGVQNHIISTLEYTI